MILLTGATGYLGKDLLKALLKFDDVRIFSRRKMNHKNAFQGDITRLNDVKAAMHDIDGVVHAAALIDHFATYQALHKVNVNGTENIFKAADQLDIEKVVHISSVGVSKNFMTPYCFSKRNAETAARKYSRQLTVPIIRPARIYDESKISRLNRWFPMFNRDVKFHFVYKHALISAITSAYKNGKSEIYTVADKNPISLHNLYETIADIVGFKPFYIPHSFVESGIKISGLIEKFSNAIGVKTPITPEFILTMLEEEDYDISLSKSRLGYKPVETISTWKKLLRKINN